MSEELEAVRESLAELERLDKPLLLRSLMDAHLRLRRLEGDNEAQLVNCRHHSRQADLFSRRCDLVVAICCNTEDGLTRETLDRIAAIIWPSTPDLLEMPSSVPQSQTVEQMSTRINTAEFLLGQVDAMLVMLDGAMPPGFNYGDYLTSKLTSWRSDVKAWREGKPLTKDAKESGQQH